MSEQNREQNKAKIGKRPNKILRLLIFICVLVVIGLLIWRSIFFKSAEEQLADIQAKRSIPDSENAAILYNKLFADYNESDIKPDFLSSAMEKTTISKPWQSKDYPELAEWLEDRQNIINSLLDLSKFEKCSFPIPDLFGRIAGDTILSPADSPKMDFLGFIKQCSFLLAKSANNDISEGRLEDALEKSLSLIQMGKHFKDQPEETYFLIGIASESIGSRCIRYIIFNNDVSETQLQKIETAFEMPGSFEKETEEIYAIERLRERASSPDRSLYERFMIWRNLKMPAKRELKEVYVRFSTDYRANSVFIALRRYKNKTGQWPESLNEIKQLAPSEAFIDSATGKQLKYEKQGQDFSLSGEAIKIWPR